MAHFLIEIKDQALQLSPKDRTRLAGKLLISLDENSEAAEEIEKLWASKAQRRFQELQEGWRKERRPARVFGIYGQNVREGNAFSPSGQGGDAGISTIS